MSPVHRLSGFDLACSTLGGLVLLGIVAPLLAMFVNCSFPELAGAARDPVVRNSIWLTLGTSMAGTLICALGAVPLAYVLARKNFPLKRSVASLINLPLVIPHSAAGIAVLGVIAGNSLSGKALRGLGLNLVGTPAAIVIAMAFVSIPFLINSAREGFLAVPQRLEAAAMSLGASPARVFFTIAVPLAGRAILSGMVMMWARGMSEFGAVVIVAYHPMITPVLIFERFGSFGLKYARPVAALFVAVCLAVFLLLRLLSREKHHAES